ncbi:PepSY domain-containing protein [Paraglaciecola sp. L3A3]|uniref:PepSY-associated TM helix domain-containing protein n=1 Tax=Paraglaciecola sp. L3A3 TaxID=2686358 RepID=UPI00131B7A23|nr:PepSY domain-containing protein [Paraglaciecola sp. L3A3]
MANSTEHKSRRVPRIGRWHQTVWRWHFYAGLIVAPFLFILSVTGATYLFNDEINDALYPEQRFVAQILPALPVSHLITAALVDYPEAKVTRVDQPTEIGRSGKVYITTNTGESRRVYVDPGTAQTLGSYVYTSTLVGFADVFHGSLFLGRFGDGIVELMACWSFILLITGVYLWLPSQLGSMGKMLLPSFTTNGRSAWRSWHGVIGLWSAFILGFLILTGLPWANVWGGLLRSATDNIGMGYPENHSSHGTVPISSKAKPATMQLALGSAPWALEDTPMPVSDERAAHHGSGGGTTLPDLQSGIGIDKAIMLFAEKNMNSPYRLFLPKDPQGVYTAYTYPNQPQGQRTIHLDQYTGDVLGEVSFSDYGMAAKAVEIGVQLHMGNYFGLANQLLMLAGCFGGIVLSISGPVMWWKRRPSGRLAAPRKPISSVKQATMVWLVVLLGCFFPLAGASLLSVLLFEYLWRVFHGGSKR